MPVTIAPTINTLFYIAYNKTAILMSDTIIEKNFKVRPLHSTCILKLINHDVTKLSSNLFIYERRVLFIY